MARKRALVKHLSATWTHQWQQQHLGVGMALASAVIDMRICCVGVDSSATRRGAGGIAINCKVHGKVTRGAASAPFPSREVPPCSPSLKGCWCCCRSLQALQPMSSKGGATLQSGSERGAGAAAGPSKRQRRAGMVQGKCGEASTGQRMLLTLPGLCLWPLLGSPCRTGSA